MIALLALALLAQDLPPKKAPDPAKIDELIRKTNELRAFDAEYKMSSGTDGASVRLAYRAPDECRFEVMGSLMVGRHGVVDFRMSPPGGKAVWAKVSLVDAGAAQARELSDAIAREFPAIGYSWTLPQEWGPTFRMTLSTVDVGRHDDFHFDFAYSGSRGTLLGWLDFLKRSSDTSVEGEEDFVLRTPRGSELRVSGRTGFVESMHGKGEQGEVSFELASLDLDPKFDHGEFDAPEPDSDARDASEQFAKQFGQLITSESGKRFSKWISEKVAAGKPGWDADARVHSRKVMVALLSVEVAADSRRWTDDTRKWIDGLEKWIRECRSSAPGGSGELSAEAQAKLHESRERLLETIRSAESSRLSGSSLVPDDLADSKLKKDLEDLWDEAWTAAFTRIVHDPLVNAFDDTVARATSGG